MNDLNSIKRNVRRRLISAGIRNGLTAFRHAFLAKGDVLIASYPKSGNTWLRFLLASLAGAENHSFHNVSEYVPELSRLPSRPKLQLRLNGGGRLVKSHEPASDAYLRGVYLVRHPGDVVQSYYRHQLRTGEFTGDFPHFVDSFVKARVDGYGRWDLHVASWIDKVEQFPDSFLIVKYEDLLKNTAATLHDVATFAGLPVDLNSVALAIRENSRGRMMAKESLSEAIPSVPGSNIKFVGNGSPLSGCDLDSHLTKVMRESFGATMIRAGYLM